jgi:hypothetical protein
MRLSNGEKMLFGVGFAMLVLGFIAVAYGLSGLLFAAAWNFLMPSLWHAAPHFSWKMGVAAAWLIGIVQTIFGGGFKLPKQGS